MLEARMGERVGEELRGLKSALGERGRANRDIYEVGKRFTWGIFSVSNWRI
jgi:hypothetical protein